MTRIIISIGILLLVTPCLAQEQERYHNEAGHFSFTLPKGWKIIPHEQLSEHYKTMLKVLRLDHAVAIMKLKSEDSEFPCIAIQSKKWEYTEDRTTVENFFKFFELDSVGLKQSGTQQRMEHIAGQIRKDESIFPKSWRAPAKADSNVYYDDKKHASFCSVTLTNEIMEDIILARIQLLGDHRKTTLVCFGNNRGSESFLDLVHEVADSFSYDKNYGFDETSEEFVGADSEGLFSTDKANSSADINKHIVNFIVGALVFAVFLRLAMVFTEAECSFITLVFICAASSLVSLIPVVGFAVSAIVMAVLICKLAEAEFWPDAVLMVVLAQGLEIFVRGIIITNIFANT